MSEHVCPSQMQSRKIRWIIQVEESPWQGESVEEQISSIKGKFYL